jgi:hypothetical protein
MFVGCKIDKTCTVSISDEIESLYLFCNKITLKKTDSLYQQAPGMLVNTAFLRVVSKLQIVPAKAKQLRKIISALE